MRFQLADAALATAGLTAERQALQAAREAYLAEHPTYAAYQAWADRVREAYPDLAIYRTEVSRGNANAERYFRETEERIATEIDPATDPAGYKAALDRATTGVAAYRAVQGIRGNLYDPNPLPTQTDRAVYDPATSAGGTGQGAAYTPADPAQQIAESLARYQTDEMIYNGLLVQITGNPEARLDRMNPMLRAAMTANIESAYGLRPPTLSGWARDYVQWAEAQEPGADQSIEAFLVWRDQWRAQAAAAAVGGSGPMPPALLPPTLNGQLNGGYTSPAGYDFSTFPLPLGR